MYFPHAPELAALPWVATDDVDENLADAWSDPKVSADTLAFLQYTFGSTASPKGVMVSHGNVLHDGRTIQEAFQHSENTVLMGWLPLFHDMGLIGKVLQPLYLGASSVLMSPAAFRQRPISWLAAITRYRGTTAGGPNFGYDLCAQKITPEERRNLDLSSWTAAFNRDVIQPVLFAIDVGLSQLWRSWGIEPDAVVGHSMGEIAAAHFAGGLTLPDALRITCWRSRLMARMSGLGAMAVVELPLDRVECALAGYQDRLSVAASNSPTSTVLWGDPAALDEVMNALQRKEIFCRLVKVDVAAHSPQLDPLRQEMLEGLAGIQPTSAAIPFFSTIRSGSVDTFDTHYGWRNMRETVHFAAAVERLLESGHDLFVGISPHPILQTAISDSLRVRGREGTVLPSLRRDAEERATMLASLGALYSLGWPLDWSRQFPAPGRCIQLPSYPWQRERGWTNISTDSKVDRFELALEAGAYSHPLLGRELNLSRSSGDHFWERRLNAQTTPPFVLDHRDQGAVVFPGAAYVEMALAAAQEVFGAGPWIISETQFQKALFLPENATRCVQSVLSTGAPGEGTFQVYSRPFGAETEKEPWVLHATGKISVDSDN